MMANIHNDWKEFINNNNINTILNNIDNNETIYPNKNDILKSLKYFSPKETKLVILGQDPYIGFEIINNIKIPQACGLAFSVPKEHKKIPPSLKNIFKEIKNSYPDYNIPNNGCLERWYLEEKILLLNCSLTVIEGKSNSHAKYWLDFTNKLIKYISEINDSTIFLLMGNYAIQKENLINNKHKIFKTVHPSPLSAYNGFFGCNVFKQINDYLIENNKLPINW